MATTEQNIVYLLPNLKYGKFIKGLLHTPDSGDYRTLQLIQGATEFQRKIPKSYIYSEEYYYVARDFGIGFTKSEAKALREEFINEIIKVILNLDKTDRNEEMLPDNYARLFHALAILKVPKDTELLPGTTKNLIYNSMYMFWFFDDGSQKAYDVINDGAWCMAEEIKKRSGKRKPEDDNHLIVGIRLTGK